MRPMQMIDFFLATYFVALYTIQQSYCIFDYINARWQKFFSLYDLDLVEYQLLKRICSYDDFDFGVDGLKSLLNDN